LRPARDPVFFFEIKNSKALEALALFLLLRIFGLIGIYAVGFKVSELKILTSPIIFLLITDFLLWGSSAAAFCSS
jgi:hypothetical protein